MIRNITLTSIGHAACTIIRIILMLLMSLSDVNGNGLAAVIQFLILGIVQAVGISFLGLHALRSRGLLTGWSTAMRAVASYVIGTITLVGIILSRTLSAPLPAPTLIMEVSILALGSTAALLLVKPGPARSAPCSDR